MTEWFDIVDTQGQRTGQKATRSDVHGDPTLIHQAVHCLVFNSAGDCYLQKRALNKDTQPGKWDSSVGGHVNASEHPDQAILREMQEELGIDSIPVTFCYQYIMQNPFESEWIRTYTCIFDGAIRIDPEEIMEGCFWTRDTIEKALGTEVFTPNFEDEWSRFKEYSHECKFN